MADLDITLMGTADGAQQDVFAILDAADSANELGTITWLMRGSERVAAIVSARVARGD